MKNNTNDESNTYDSTLTYVPDSKSLHSDLLIQESLLYKSCNFAKYIFKSILIFARQQAVLSVAIIATIITCFFVPIDSAYLGSFNWRTLATLFCTLAVVSAFSHIHVFEILSRSIVIKLHNLRNATLALVFITFFGSMLLANDMALLTFLPLGYFVLNSTNNKQAMAFTFIMQNIAANLGGMITAFGNPQNLYLYSYYHIDTLEFSKIMLPSFTAATIMIFLICMFVKKTPLQLEDDKYYELNKKRALIYSVLFICSIAIVFRIIPYFSGTIVITILLLYLDRKSIREVNYPLLLTFCVFFIFSGNMARIPAVSSFFASVLPINTLLFGILSCQFISNVPSAVLLSHFTDNYASLLPAVNIGGCGTLIASLASLITFTEYKKHNPDKTGKYIILFSIFNFGFVLLLYLVQMIFTLHTTM